MGKGKKKKVDNTWDKKRLLIEVVLTLFTCFVSVKFGEEKTQIVYNGDVITYEIYADTVQSIEEINVKSSENISGQEIVDYALQFEGNPYIWGGTSLTHGADTSGFVSSVFNHFGMALPHSSSAIKAIGEIVDISDVQLGDVICYENHVGIYVGDNKIIHASNAKTGIIVTDMYYKKPWFARRII